ncbi:MAG: thermonuclease family protein [bacterium]|nr:thermonuclease family protein [bacterium]
MLVVHYLLTARRGWGHITAGRCESCGGQNFHRAFSGATGVVDLDFGFRIRTRHKLRLRGIDTPELPGPLARKAKKFVQRALAQVSFIVLTTTKVDKYDRYLSDVFYLPGEMDPETVVRCRRFLNRELVEAGLAKRVRR